MAKFVANSKIFLVSNSRESGFLAFSSVAGALTHVADSHGDLNAEGAALMLATPGGLVPATNKATLERARWSANLEFSASSADVAAKVAKIQSNLKGALQACALVGVDPASVAKVADLREELETAQASVVASEDSATFLIKVVPLHKRQNKTSKRS